MIDNLIDATVQCDYAENGKCSYQDAISAVFYDLTFTHDLTFAILYNKNVTQSSVIEQARRVYCLSIKGPTIHVNLKIPACNNDQNLI